MPALTAATSPKLSRVLRVGLVGAGIQSSRSPAMHVAAGRALGLDLSYDLIDTDTATWEGLPLETVLTRLEQAGYAGVNVTFPHKRAALGLCDTVAPSAAAVGATNTVVFQNGRRIAHNTDYSGFAAGFLGGIGGRDLATALLLGAGGAGGAVAHALVDHGVKRLFVHDTDHAAAETLVAAITARLGPGRAQVAGDLRIAAAAAAGIVNATPVGMLKLPGIPMDPALIEARHWVADIVYVPLETQFLRTARAKGCHTIDGSGMAVGQAVAAFEHFTGLQPDAARMRATFDSLG